ncbi:toll/interleukin-1 receptor domain-containing protein [Bacillus bombysepticus]|uniref:SEFIR domain-containing protein n=1 Tax=Bacillus bombysepticus str. Wang TaxID=1330043 RepID=A0A9W3PSK9_9BACI|nr:toll/interleukin-1 receptor domain-containing protein [Bacillus bombysepticus]AHX20196.1 SEFIR domain-containing protein [Bacillus bombysepticus str. Wang]
MNEHPKVFISYTHDSKEHADYILNFSNRLRKEGIDTVLDQYETSPSEGWPRWMDRQVRSADFVIMVCTPTYFKRVMGEEEVGKGLGGIWEGNLIYQHLYNDGGINTKFIPVLFDGGSYQDIPTPLQGATHYYVENQEGFDKLYWRLRNVNPVNKPELGKLRPLPEKERKSLLITGFIDVEQWDKAKWIGIAYFFDKKFERTPTMVLVFENKEAAENIFQQWLARFGEFDKYNELRISLIEGKVPQEQDGYYVHVSANSDNVISRLKEDGIEIEDDFIVRFSRTHRMNPSKESRNLEMFKDTYAKHGAFYIMPGVLRNKKLEWIGEDLSILKKDVNFRNVKDIESVIDPDSVVLPKYRNYTGVFSEK